MGADITGFHTSPQRFSLSYLRACVSVLYTREEINTGKVL